MHSIKRRSSDEDLVIWMTDNPWNIFDQAHTHSASSSVLHHVLENHSVWVCKTFASSWARPGPRADTVVKPWWWQHSTCSVQTTTTCLRHLRKSPTVQGPLQKVPSPWTTWYQQPGCEGHVRMPLQSLHLFPQWSQLLIPSASKHSPNLKGHRTAHMLEMGLLWRWDARGFCHLSQDWWSDEPCHLEGSRRIRRSRQCVLWIPFHGISVAHAVSSAYCMAGSHLRTRRPCCQHGFQCSRNPLSVSPWQHSGKNGHPAFSWSQPNPLGGTGFDRKGLINANNDQKRILGILSPFLSPKPRSARLWVWGIH